MAYYPPGGPVPSSSPGYPQAPFNPSMGAGYPPAGGPPPPVGFSQPGYQESAPGYPQQGVPQAGYPGSAPGYPQQGVPQAGYPGSAPGYPQQGFPQAGYPEPGLPQGPITNQPVSMSSGAPTQHVALGLEYLSQVDQLLVHQQVELLEAFIGFETNNRYTVKNNMGQPVFYAVEENDCCTRMCCGAARPFEMRLMDHQQREVLRLSRPLRCDSCWFPCFLQRLEVRTGGGELLGTVKQHWSICGPAFGVYNSRDQQVLKINGPCCTCSMCGDVDFDVVALNGGNRVGRISKQWSGLAKELFTDSDNFGVTFPMELGVAEKATVMAATFLIDFMFFEKSGNKNNDLPGMF